MEGGGGTAVWFIKRRGLDMTLIKKKCIELVQAATVVFPMPRSLVAAQLIHQRQPHLPSE